MFASRVWWYVSPTYHVLMSALLLFYSFILQGVDFAQCMARSGHVYSHVMVEALLLSAVGGSFVVVKLEVAG